MTICVCVILVILALGVLGKRVRDNGGINKTLKKIRVRGTWFIHGGSTIESDSPPNTCDPSLSDRRSSSTDFIVESYPHSERKGDNLSWQPIKVPVSSEGVDGATCIIGERGRDNRKWTPLHCEAVRSSGEHTLREILGQDGSMVDVQGPGGFTPLMIAVTADDKSSTNRHRLVPVRSDSSSSSDQSERDILINNSQQFMHNPNLILPPIRATNNYPIISAFITQHANLNITNDYGQTALHLAAKHGREDYIHILLSAKADPNVQDIWGQTALHVSIGAATDRAFKVLRMRDRRYLFIRREEETLKKELRL